MTIQAKIDKIIKRAKFLKDNDVKMSDGHPNLIFIQAELESLVGLEKAKTLLSEVTK